jgi:hypothetical protein
MERSEDVVDLKVSENKKIRMILDETMTLQQVLEACAVFTMSGWILVLYLHLYK